MRRQSSEDDGGDTRSKNNAIAQGNLSEADRLDDLSARFALQFPILIRHELKKIDDSDLMLNTIKGFAYVNKQIEEAISSVKKLTEFSKAATNVAGALDKAIKSSLGSG